MHAFLEGIRAGAFVTRERMRLIAFAVLFASLVGLGFILLTSNGVTDYQGRPIGTDFSNVYAAGTYVLEGHPEKPFDPAAQHAREQAIFGAATPFYGWHYPPFFLFVAAVLALMPYGLALAVWQVVTFGLYLWAIRAVLVIPRTLGEGASEPTGRREAPPDDRLREEAGGVSHPQISPPVRLRRPPSPFGGGISGDHLWLLLAAAYPAVFINLGHGHNGFLTAALVGGALILLDRKPLLAGILFGLLAYKPQFGLLIPLVLVASGRWRAFGAAAATVVLLGLATTIAFGPQVWDAFMASTGFTRAVVLEAGETGWHKIQSVFSWVRMWGGPVPLAYAEQGAVTLAAAGALVWLWRSEAAFALKATALAIAVILATPYSLDYDMMVLAVAIAFLAADGLARGFAPYEKSALAFLWLVPLITRSFAELTLIPLGVVAMLMVFALTLRRAGLFVKSSGWISAHLPIR